METDFRPEGNRWAGFVPIQKNVTSCNFVALRFLGLIGHLVNTSEKLLKYFLFSLYFISFEVPSKSKMKVKVSYGST